MPPTSFTFIAARVIRRNAETHARAVASLALAVAFAACGGDLHGRDAGGHDARVQRDARVDRDASPVADAGPSDAGPALVTLSHARELRAGWVATVFNLTWPSRTGLSEGASRDEIRRILDVMAELRMNAVIVQVRPESDALYRSELEPWSRFLSGTQGTDPGWDPLAAWIDEAHARAIEVHAWMNPYRGMASASATRAENHVTRTLSAHAHPWGTGIWMDPGAPPVRAHVVAVVRDLVTRYDVDGVHFDDYFYPYPDGSRTFPDDATYAAYVAEGGTLARADWRRDNVNALVREVGGAIAEIRSEARFGISPFGIHRPGMPPGIVGLDAYATLFADAPRWIAEGWVDYLAPQLYWPSTQTAQAFGALLAWWAALPRDGGRAIFAGMNLTRLGETDAWTIDEFRAQVALVREARDAGALGTILYTVEPLVDDRLGIRALFRDELFAAPAATPPLAGTAGSTLAAPAMSRDGSSLSLRSSARLRAYAIYARRGEGWALSRLVPALDPTVIELDSGEHAVSAIDRRGVESAGVLVTVP